MLLQSDISLPKSLWTQHLSDEGIPFYYNIMTKISTWDPPPEFSNTRALTKIVGTLDSESLKKIEHILRPGFLKNGPKGANVFIFHLPRTWTDAILIKHFSPFGKIVSTHIQKDEHGNNRGYAFVSYDSVKSAEDAIEGMNGMRVEGKWLKVEIKKENQRFSPY